MDRRRAMLWAMLAGSTLTTIYGLWPAGAPVKSAATRAPVNVGQGNAQAAEAAAPAAPPLSEQEWTAWRGRLAGAPRDPFFTMAEIAEMSRPPVAKRQNVAPASRPAPPDYNVKLVMMTGSQGRALIGDQIVKVGDMLGDERVIEIRRNEVVLEHSGARRRLELATGAVLATSGSSGPQIQPERTR